MDRQNKNIEVQIAAHQIKLLKQYAKNPTQRALQQMHPMVRAILSRKTYSPETLAMRIAAAIKLDNYRPRNMSLFQLAISNDLNHISGKFNTFDSKLSRMAQSQKNLNKILDRFDSATINRIDLAKQFANDWIRRINQHPDLALAAQKSRGKNAIDAYNNLFNALRDDFCREYKLDPESVLIEVIDGWDNSVIRPEDTSEVNGFTNSGYILEFPKDTSSGEIDKLYQEFLKSPETHPMAKQQHWVIIDLYNCRANRGHTTVFNQMMTTFAHEMHHALDNLLPRAGALGPQVRKIDKETYHTAAKNINSYHKSATERSSYAIGDELMKRLKNKQND